MKTFAIVYIIAFVVISVVGRIIAASVFIPKTLKDPSTDSIADAHKDGELNRHKKRLYMFTALYGLLFAGFLFSVLFLISSAMGTSVSSQVVVLLGIALAVYFGLKSHSYISTHILHMAERPPSDLSNKEQLAWHNTRYDEVRKHLGRVLLTIFGGVFIITAVIVIGILIIVYFDLG